MNGMSVSTSFTNVCHLQQKHLAFYLAFLDVAKAYDSDPLRNWHPPENTMLIKLLYGDTRYKIEKSPTAA